MEDIKSNERPLLTIHEPKGVKLLLDSVLALVI